MKASHHWAGLQAFRSGPGASQLHRVAVLAGPVLFALTTWLTGMAPPAALAIPEAEAVKKLAVIPVYILVNDRGVPLPVPREKVLVLPLYLDRTQAEAELATIRKAKPEVKAQLMPIPLNVVNEKIAQLNKTVKNANLVSVVVPNRKDMEQAVILLRKQGLNDKAIKEGLVLPVFFTKPLITVKTPQGERGLFFVDYASFQRALSSIPDKSKLQPQAADITAVMQQIIQKKEDSYAFFPTPDYFQLVEQQSRQGSAPAGRAPGSSGSAPAPADRR